MHERLHLPLPPPFSSLQVNPKALHLCWRALSQAEDQCGVRSQGKKTKRQNPKATCPSAKSGPIIFSRKSSPRCVRHGRSRAHFESQTDSSPLSLLVFRPLPTTSRELQGIQGKQKSNAPCDRSTVCRRENVSSESQAQYPRLCKCR